MGDRGDALYCTVLPPDIKHLFQCPSQMESALPLHNRAFVPPLSPRPHSASPFHASLRGHDPSGGCRRPVRNPLRLKCSSYLTDWLTCRKEGETFPPIYIYMYVYIHIYVKYHILTLKGKPSTVLLFTGMKGKRQHSPFIILPYFP